MNKSIFRRTYYDAIIIGARCAGSATALELARTGASVLLVDRDHPGNDTLSTHALMRPAIALLNDWGVIPEIEKSGTPLVTATTFHYGGEKIPVAVKPGGDIKGLYAPRRNVLDQVLADAAVAAGAEMHTGVSFLAATKDAAGRVRGALLATSEGKQIPVSCGILIGADGRQSAVAHQVGAATQIESQERTAVVYGYFKGLPNEGYRWFFGHNSYSGAIPTNDGAHCVFAGVRPDRFKGMMGSDPLKGMRAVLSECDPDLAEHLRIGPVDGKLRRYGGAFGHMRECAGPGWALVGDAGYFKDPVTAHGITDAFLDAHRLVHALQSDLSFPMVYQQERNAKSAGMFEVTRKIAALNSNYDTLKSLHQDLNQIMKTELAELRTPRLAPVIAA